MTLWSQTVECEIGACVGGFGKSKSRRIYRLYKCGHGLDELITSTVLLFGNSQPRTDFRHAGSDLEVMIGDVT